MSKQERFLQKMSSEFDRNTGERPMSVLTLKRLLPAVILGIVLAYGGSAQATFITLDLNFSDPGWSGSVTFDDTTGQAWNLDPLITAFLITDMSITDGTVVWDETEILSYWVPPNGGVLQDTAGNFAVFAEASDTATSAPLVSSIGLLPGILGQASFFTATAAVSYTATVIPEPTGILLFSTGMLLVGRAVRRRTA
jgi:hypothetical protein